MSKNEWTKSIGVVGRMLLAFGVIFSQAAFAGQNQSTQDKAEPSAKASTQQAGEKPTSAATTLKVQSEEAKGEAADGTVAGGKNPGNGRHEGIKVHGHWTIEVRNPDGALVTHREFENSLASSGSTVLAAILACYTAGNCPNQTNAVAIEVSLNGNPSPCTIASVDPTTGQVTTVPGPCIVGNTPQSLATGAQGAIFVLNGSIAASESGNISQVSTVIPTSGPTGGILTAATLSTPVQVNAGQTVAVTVNISFS